MCQAGRENMMSACRAGQAVQADVIGGRMIMWTRQAHKNVQYYLARTACPKGGSSADVASVACLRKIQVEAAFGAAATSASRWRT